MKENMIIKCYICKKMGYYKSECHQAKKFEEVHLVNIPKLTLQNMEIAPTRN